MRSGAYTGQPFEVRAVCVCGKRVAGPPGYQALCFECDRLVPIPTSARCAICNGPAHEATGHVFSREPVTILCGMCARRMVIWIKDQMARQFRITRRGEKPARYVHFYDYVNSSIAGSSH